MTSKVDLNVLMSEPITDIAILEKDPTNMRHRMELMILKIQHTVCRALEAEEEGQKFIIEKWDRAESQNEIKQGDAIDLSEEMGGGGVTCVMQDGKVFEKAGVNVSVVNGFLPDSAANQMRARGKNLGTGKLKFFAAGISSVIHPRNPYIPTMHFNYRLFEVSDDDNNSSWWYGGGTDLTPYYLLREDVEHFHKEQKKACDLHHIDFYPRFKKWCDTYFYITHRHECRGVGGIFFDDLDETDMSGLNREELFQFLSSAAAAIVPAYLPLVNKHKNDDYSEADRTWQLLRRGRYAEFNLVYDRGTKFGLMTPNARIESIMMSLPLLARWEYGHVPTKGSREEILMEVLKNPIEWIK